MVKIWRSLKNGDLGRPGTIKKVLISTGVHGMSDELRKALKQTRGEVMEVSELMPAPQKRDNNTPKFKGLLGEYVEYIQDVGTFAGAHRHMADTKGIKIHLARKRFHQAVKETFG